MAVLSGLGLATVHALATQAPDSIYIMACRSVDDGSQAVQELRRQDIKSTIEVIELDVTKDSSIQAATEFLSQKYGKIDGEFGYIPF